VAWATRVRWESSSAIGRDFTFLPCWSRASSQFIGPIDTRMGRLYYYSYGVALDTVDKKSVRLTLTVAQTEDQLEGENAVYRRTLVIWLSILGVMLIVLQLLLLRWSLTPLRKVASDMSRVERGDSEHLDSQYPLELTGLTERINAFIDNEREQRTRYRHTLADLAHSLKTPLAVIRSQLESAAGDEASRRSGVLDQVRRWTSWSPTSCRAPPRRVDRPSPAPCRSPVTPKIWCRVWKRSTPPRTSCANSTSTMTRCSTASRATCWS
jgi:two-component system sensor histidine kinase PhoQ